MKTKEIIIHDKKQLSISDITNDIRKLVIKCDKKINENDLFSSQIYSYIFKVTIECTKLEILDISDLDFLDINIDIRHLREVYLPSSIEFVSFEKSTTLRKVSALGANTIIITDCPNFEEIEYGKSLHNLCLSRTGVVSITIPSNINLIDDAFKNCYNLESVVIGNGTDIPARTFEGCSNLKNVTLPNDLPVLEPFVFRGCKNLRTINGGLSIKQLFPSALSECTKLEHIESVLFYQYTNLDLTNESWITKFRPRYYSYPSEKKLNEIKDFANSLTKKIIKHPESYIANNFLHTNKKQTGIMMKYFYVIGRWCIWSITQQKFLISSKTYNNNFKIGDIILYYDNNIPDVEIDKHIDIYRNLSFINLSEAEIIQRDMDNDNDLNEIIDYFNPQESFQHYYLKTKKIIEELDIPSIIDSYSITEECHLQIRPGKDDHEFYKHIATSIYTDAYLGKLLPIENYENYTSGVFSCYNEKEENEKLKSSAIAEASRFKKNAYNNYSATEHLCTLLQEFIDKRLELENSIESKYHLKTIRDFINDYYIPHTNDIEEDHALRILCNYSLEELILN